MAALSASGQQRLSLVSLFIIDPLNVDLNLENQVITLATSLSKQTMQKWKATSPTWQILVGVPPGHTGGIGTGFCRIWPETHCTAWFCWWCRCRAYQCSCGGRLRNKYIKLCFILSLHVFILPVGIAHSSVRYRARACPVKSVVFCPKLYFS